MIDIQYNKKIKIGSDGLNYIIYNSCENKKTKETVWRAKYFYVSLEHLIDSLVESEIRNSDAKTFEELKESIKDVKKHCIKLFEEYESKK